MSLFPSFEEQVGTIAAAQAEINYPKPAAFFLPQEQLDTILRSGGGRDNNRKRIYAKYQQGKTPEEMTEILKDEYQITGKGFELEGHPVSVWFDESGMRVGYGTSAKQAPVAEMSWHEIERHIRLMVEEGSYMSSNEAFLVDAVERQRVARQLFFFFRDGMGVTPESLDIKNGNYPVSESHLMDLLAIPEGAELISKELTIAKELLDSREKKLRWRYVKSPEYLLDEVAGFGVPKIVYPAQNTVDVRHEDFITQDEIDARLTGGSGFSHGQFRIYEYFMEEHDKKDAITFLKNEYGTGGSSHALPGSDQGHEDHDAKGLRLEKGSYGNPYAKVLLKWNVVEKRIRELVERDQYLTPAGKEAYAAYKQEQAEEAMRKEQERLEHGVRKEQTDKQHSGHIQEQTKKQVLDNDAALAQMLSEMAVVAMLVGELGRKDAVDWKEETGSLLLKDGGDTLEGKAAYDILFVEATERIFDLTLNGEMSKALELDALVKDAQKYAVRYGTVQVEQAQKQEEINEPVIETVSDNFSDIYTNADNITPIIPLTAEISEPVLPKSQKPSIDRKGAKNYHITVDNLAELDAKSGNIFPKKERFRNNVEAIHTLEQVESEHRLATPEEQQILAKYVGWGGLADAFDDTKANWHSEYHELKALLSPEEYTSARESTLNAHYTSPVIIKGMEEMQMATADTEREKVREIIDKLEQGLKEVFENEKYKAYLNSMSKFHTYSINNTMLITMQRPEATLLVAGYQAWQKNFDRHVKKGEKGIRILAPMSYQKKEEQDMIDPETQELFLDEKGNLRKETVEYTIPGFRTVTIFDASQTEGKELPRMEANGLLYGVDGYERLMQALTEVSPVPMTFENVESGAKGYFHRTEQRIVLQEGMSESQTVKTAVYKIAHAMLHNQEFNQNMEQRELPIKDKNTIEVETESVAYTVCQHFGIDTSDYSFGYLADWSSGKEMSELRSSLETIRKTASELITQVDGQLQGLEVTQNVEQDREKSDGQQTEIIPDNISVMKRAEQYIDQLEAGKTIFTNDERNLIVNYAYKIE